MGHPSFSQKSRLAAGGKTSYWRVLSRPWRVWSMRCRGALYRFIMSPGDSASRRDGNILGDMMPSNHAIAVSLLFLPKPIHRFRVFT
jgi:hypothetical protein